MVSLSPPIQLTQTKMKPLRQKVPATGKPLQHTLIQPWVKEAGVVVVVMAVVVEAAVVHRTTSNASVAGLWVIMPPNALEPLKMLSEC